MTKASVRQTTQSAPFLPSYIIALPHTHTHREHTHRDTRTKTHTERHTPTHTMLLHVSKCFNIHAHTMPFFAHLPVGPPASALYLSKTLVAWAMYVQGPPHLLANLLTHPTKSSSLYSKKPLVLPSSKFWNWAISWNM